MGRPFLQQGEQTPNASVQHLPLRTGLCFERGDLLMDALDLGVDCRMRIRLIGIQRGDEGLDLVIQRIELALGLLLGGGFCSAVHALSRGLDGRSGYTILRASETSAEERTAVPPVHDLERFVQAQDPVFAEVTGELERGRKTSHWMWFVFPQIQGLGHSAMARHYALASLEEARAYWSHPVLGARLRRCTELILAIENRSAAQIFGSPDDMKLRSCLTLFHRAAPEAGIFGAALNRFFGGAEDPLTIEALGRH